MKKYLILLVPVLFGCNNENTSAEHVDDGNLMSVNKMDTCSCDELQADEHGMELLNGNPFTGICYSNYPQTDIKYIEKSLLEGKLHGKVTYFTKTGEVLIEEIYESGKQKRSGSSDALECSCSELEVHSTPGVSIVKYTLDDIPYTGKCYGYYSDADTGQIYLESYYRDGFLDGNTIYYDRDGSTLYFEEYKSGELIRVVYEGS